MNQRALTAIVALVLAGAAAADDVTYELGPRDTVKNLYPDASWLPSEYKDRYPDLAKTIESFTKQSLRRDGLDKATVNVKIINGNVRVTITGAGALGTRYRQVHPAFLDKDHAQAGLRAVEACQQSRDACWNRSGTDQPKSADSAATTAKATKEKATKGKADKSVAVPKPWAFYLPLGMAMGNQKAVMFMNYPPLSALAPSKKGQQGDYLYNFTMCRWNQVLLGVGADKPDLYQTIVDSRPIAAPGSGEDKLLPDVEKWFDSNTKPGEQYVRPMLKLLADRGRDNGSGSDSVTLPVGVFGGTAGKTWANIVGLKDPALLTVGTTTKVTGKATTPWIITAHPDVTTYNYCQDDPTKDKDPNYPSHNLVGSEQDDFVAACWLIEMARDGSRPVEEVKKQCTDKWKNNPGTDAKMAVCVQAKLDNNNKDARCNTYAEALSYCKTHDANACATLDCKTTVKQAKKTPQRDRCSIAM